jgi:hypothetical protein
MQSDAATHLRGAGVTVSDIHNARLTVDLDCVPVNPAVRGGALAVHQCPGFSELVSAPNSQPILANTCRQCES